MKKLCYNNLMRSYMTCNSQWHFNYIVFSVQDASCNSVFTFTAGKGLNTSPRYRCPVINLCAAKPGLQTATRASAAAGRSSQSTSVSTDTSCMYMCLITAQNVIRRNSSVNSQAGKYKYSVSSFSHVKKLRCFSSSYLKINSIFWSYRTSTRQNLQIRDFL